MMTRIEEEPILRITGLTKTFYLRKGIRREPMRALNGVDLVLRRGEILGVIGESGSGKSTLANVIMGLEEPDSGEIVFDGRQIDPRRSRSQLGIARDIQIVFQDPYSSLNPRMRVKTILKEPLRHERFAGKQELHDRCAALLRMVGLPESALTRYPHQFSGGQRQRIAIARALALDPKVLVCDEAVSALDVSIQAQILTLLLELRDRLGLSIIFIAHGLPAVERVSDRVMVMNGGDVVETGLAQQVLQYPSNDYTRKLVEVSRDIIPFKLMTEEDDEEVGRHDV
jgi:peptide/nickel transport system ATP-binding protein